MSVNFRLSSGLGKKLINAGNGEWGRKALFDLIDGVQWCIGRGITAKEKVGIMNTASSDGKNHLFLITLRTVMLSNPFSISHISPLESKHR